MPSLPRLANLSGTSEAFKGDLLMAGEKQTIEIELNNDHVTVMRIIMDYLQENKDVHDTVFKQTRCLRCD